MLEMPRKRVPRAQCSDCVGMQSLPSFRYGVQHRDKSMVVQVRRGLEISWEYVCQEGSLRPIWRWLDARWVKKDNLPQRFKLRWRTELKANSRIWYARRVLRSKWHRMQILSRPLKLLNSCEPLRLEFIRRRNHAMQTFQRYRKRRIWKHNCQWTSCWL